MIDTNSIFTNYSSTISKKCKNSHTEYKNYNLEDDNDLSGHSGNNSKLTAPSDSGDISLSKQLVHVPDNILVSFYLKDYLETLILPSQIDNNFLIKVGEDALKSKMEYVEEHNIMYKKSKKRVPDKLGFDEVAVIMMSLFTFRNIQMTERPDDTLLAVYDNNINSPKRGTYSSSREYFYQIMERLAPSFKQRDMEDVAHKIKRAVPKVNQTKERHLFAVNNGIYNQQMDQLMPFNDQYVYLTKIPIDYNPYPINPLLTAPDGHQWDVESWFRDITDNDEDTTKLMWQVIADCLQPNYSRHKSIWFYSEKGNNGKGTVGQLIKNLLGKGNYGSLSVVDFNHEFMKSTLVGVAANIADENDVDLFIDSVKDYKASITGDDININRKYEQPLRIQFSGTNIQMMNGLPKTKDKSESFYRRIILVPFLKSFTNNGERKYIKNDYINQKEVLEYVLHKALSMDFDEYIIPQRSARLLDQYREKNNSVMEFWNQLKDEFAWDLLPTQFLYDLYLKWDDKNNPSGKTMAKRNVLEQLRNVISSQGDPWEDRTSKTTSSVRSNTRMDEDEPLISEYGLDMPEKSGKPSEWMHPTYNGNNDAKKREFNRKIMYRGFVRV